ncbi:hypothetical protein JTB14_030817 [Gonioctena quinquepunctata]|nr:hypothetical protein JTB14_030817 [Gonioctena quinquepunctata]
MPKVKDKQKYTKHYSEELFQKALNEIQDGAPKKQIADKYKIPRSTVQFRLEDLKEEEEYKMSLEEFYDIIGPTTIEELKNETEDSKHEEKSKEWKLLNIFRKFSSQVSDAETQEEVIEDHWLLN